MTAYIVRRALYAIPILIGVNIFTFALFFFVNTPDDMARMQLGLKRVTPGGDRQVEAGARLRQAGPLQRRGARARGEAHATRSSSRSRCACSRSTSAAPTTAATSAARSARACGRASRSRCRCSSSGSRSTSRFALAVAFFRATYIDFWGVVLCVADDVDLRACSTSSAGSTSSSKLWHLVPISGFEGGFDAVKFLVLPVGDRRRRRHRRRDARSTARSSSRRSPRTTCAPRARRASPRRVVLFRHVLQERHDPDPDRRGGGDPDALHGQPRHGVVLRHSGARQLHDRRHPARRTSRSCARWCSSARCSTSSG